MAQKITGEIRKKLMELERGVPAADLGNAAHILKLCYLCTLGLSDCIIYYVYIYIHVQLIPLRWCCSLFFLWFILQDVFTLPQHQRLTKPKAVAKFPGAWIILHQKEEAKHGSDAVTQAVWVRVKPCTSYALTRRWDVQIWCLVDPHTLRASSDFLWHFLLGGQVRPAMPLNRLHKSPSVQSVRSEIHRKHLSNIGRRVFRQVLVYPGSASRIDAMVRPCSETVDRQPGLKPLVKLRGFFGKCSWHFTFCTYV